MRRTVQRTSPLTCPSICTWPVEVSVPFTTISPPMMERPDARSGRFMEGEGAAAVVWAADAGSFLDSNMSAPRPRHLAFGTSLAPDLTRRRALSWAGRRQYVSGQFLAVRRRACRDAHLRTHLQLRDIIQHHAGNGRIRRHDDMART